MKESEIDKEISRLKEKRRVDKKEKEMRKLKEKVDPGLLDHIWNFIEPLWKKL